MNKIAADTNDSRFVITPAAAPNSAGFSQIYGNPSLGLDACGSLSCRQVTSFEYRRTLPGVDAWFAHRVAVQALADLQKAGLVD